MVVDLQGGVGAGPGEPDEVVAAVVDAGVHVADADVLRAKVVVHEDLAPDLGF